MRNRLAQVWNNPSWKRFSLALGISLLLHAWLVKGFLGLEYPGWDDEPEISTIQAVLLQPKAPVVAPKPAPKKEVANLPEAQPEESKPVPPLEPAPAAVPQQITPTPVAELPKPEPEKVAEETLPLEVADTDDPLPNTPTFVETDFAVTRGSAKGVMHNSYAVQPDGSYLLKSEAEAKGFISLFLGTLRQESEGMVTESGLRPNRYLYQYGKGDDKLQRASFDWQAGKLTMQNGKKIKTAPLQDGTQDLLSFMYQFMFVPPLEQMELSITNGKKLGTYNYAFEGEETLSTKMGDLRTVHISRDRDEGEKTEIWLALDYHNLPVKVRQTEKDGSVIEQVATRISTRMADSNTAPVP